jgi:hypothetical protein
LPEIVVFGQDVGLRPPAFLYAGKKILLKDAGGGRIKVSRFAPGQEDRQQFCTAKLEDVVRTVVEIGGGYDDVAQCLLEAKQKGYLEPRVVVDALPRVNREMRRSDNSGPDSEVSAEDPQKVASPMPDLFRTRLPAHGEAEDWKDGQDHGQEADVDPEKKAPEGFWEKVKAAF